MRPFPIPFNEEERQAVVATLSDVRPDEDPILREIVGLVCGVMGVPTALVSIVDDERQWFAARANFPVGETSRDYSICAHAIITPETLVIPDTHADPRFRDHPVVVNSPHVRFYVGAPIVLASGFRVGSLCALDYVGRERPEPAAIAMLESLARIVAETLDRHHAQSGDDRESERDRGARGEILALVGHEFRTPLTVILGSSRLLGARLEGADKRMADATATAARHLSDLVDNLLTFSDLSTGDVRLGETQGDMREMLRAVHLEGELLFEEGGASLALEMDDAIGQALFDPVHLKGAVTCLMMNALVHGGRVARLVGRQETSGDIVIEVMDDGAGPSGSLPSCLKPFRVGENIDTRRTGGIGLGLPLAQRIAEMHGGELDLRSKDDGFHAAITLPAWRAQPEAVKDARKAG
ncbi:GAF domain-containing sensor histidine kinase [Roseicyclus sp. F158]|uniref:histidine kinase n=1 Tax=Tropicimonas omnivorans TaxID=3075590 RepID=A0ABU3DKQ4_9RHOB|nr:GAF domain-containing sensor histidine kinase [Roseicyclus sp. F158]MDT0684304.1 GAF domain-containing sensor histidine kinase [Roseicyclus sp. F158]